MKFFLVAIFGDTSDEYLTEASDRCLSVDETHDSTKMAATVAQISSLFSHKFATSPTTAIISPIRLFIILIIDTY